MRSDCHSLISAKHRFDVGGDDLPNKAKRVYLYRLGEYQPGKDQYQHLCEECQLPDCIRVEGDFSPVGMWRDYPGCLIWEAVTT